VKANKQQQMSEDRKRLYVAAAVIVSERKVLAAERSYGDYAGWWEFPGGKIESDENPRAALTREIKEELDTEISIDRYFDTVEYDYPQFHLTMHCFLCNLLSESISLLEHREALWLGREDVYSVRWLGADLPILKKLISEKII
jgi:8-oxo-dGTP diphosphatase